MEKPIRIAHIIGKWNGGGVESVVMNYYQHIDRSKIQFDFICDEDSTNIAYEVIKKLGGRVFLIPPYQKVFKYNKELLKIFKKENYKIVHSHINTLSVFPLRLAKKANIPIRIAHSHSTSNKKEWKKNLLKQILRLFSKIYATDYFACSEYAGRWLFGNKEFEKGNVYVLNNAIDVDKFKFDEKIRKQKRKELRIKDNQIVIGHIGRFVTQKNHTFLIDIFNEVHRQNNNSVLLLVGQGPLQKEIENKVNNLGLRESVIFLGQRNDVDELYQAMDVFLFPSLYEGLGMVLIEAQCSNLPCICSTEVPAIAKVNNNLEFLSLSEPIEKWASSIKNIIAIERKSDLEKIKENNFDISEERKKLENRYLRLAKETIAIITSGFLPIPSTKGGAVENLILNLINVNELEKREIFEIFSIFDIEAVIQSKKYKYTEFKFIKPLKIVKALDKITHIIAKDILKKENSQSYKFIFQRLYFFRVISKDLHKNNYKKIILENHPSQYFVLKWHRNYKKYENNYYYHCHNIFPTEYGLHDLIIKSKSIICISAYMENYIKEKIDKECKTSILRNVIDTSNFTKELTKIEREKIRHEYGILEGDFVVLYTGRIVAEKGVLELVKAFKKIESKNIKLLIVGSSLNAISNITEYERKVKSEINNNVIFTGFINYNDIWKIYKISDISVVPSLWEEPAGLVVLESLSTGLPLIVTKSGGIPEYCNENCAIILEKDENLINNISSAILELYKNPALRNKMSAEAKLLSKKETLIDYYNNFLKIID